jgi:hypothetical protein
VYGKAFAFRTERTSLYGGAFLLVFFLTFFIEPLLPQLEILYEAVYLPDLAPRLFQNPDGHPAVFGETL